MRTISLSIVARLAIAGIIAAGSGAAAQQKAPVFRSRVDLMQLDVTVLDKNGRPVRGLTKDDFTLLEDTTPQTIQGFTAVDLPDRTIGGPVWADRVASDVTSNEIENARIFVLVIDDALSMGVMAIPPNKWAVDLKAVELMKDGAEDFLKKLGPLDLAAVVFTQRTQLSQNLTADKAKLIAAIRAFPASAGGDMLLVSKGGSMTDECLGRVYSVGTVEGTVRALSALPDRRKSIVYFGGELPWADAPDRCMVYWRWRDVFALAQAANVTINPVDTMGLRDVMTGGTVRPFLTHGAVAENTGGRAVFGENDLKPGLERIRIENSSYYLLAYQPTKGLEDGTFRRLTVRVKDRPDLEIVTRRNYWAPRVRPADEPEPPPPPPEIEAMAGLLPKADLKLRATAAAFAVPGTERAVVAIALGLKQPPLLSRMSESVELVTKIFTSDGHERGNDVQTIPITVPAARADAADSRYEVLARIEVPRPGRYELRLGALSTVSNTRGSVYVDVAVPDFRRDRVSLSGIVVSALPSPGPVAPARALNDLTPLPPTAERVFGATDLVTAFVRVYQGGNDRLARVAMKIRLADAHDAPVFEHTETLDAERFGEVRAADYQIRLPLAKLALGSYLLTLEATLAKTVVRRELVIQVRR